MADEINQTQNPPEDAADTSDSEIADLFDGGGDDNPEPEEPKSDEGHEIRYKVRGEERALKFNPKDPDAVERIKKALEKADGAEIRDAEKNRRIADLERDLAEAKAERQRKAERDDEQEAIHKKVPPLADYVEQYGDEKVAARERNRDIEVAKLNYSLEQDRKKRESQERASANDKQLETAKTNAREKYGFTNDEIDHAIMQAPINGCTTLMAALRFEYPERFVPGAAKVKKAGEEDNNVSGSNKVGTVSGSRAPSNNGSAEDFKVAARLCKGASQKDLEKAASLIDRNSARYQKVFGKKRR